MSFSLHRRSVSSRPSAVDLLTFTFPDKIRYMFFASIPSSNIYAPFLDDFTSLVYCSSSVSCIVCVGLISGSLSPFIEIPLYINLNRTLLTVYMIKMIITCVWNRKRAVLYIVQKVIKNVVVTIG